MCRAGTWGRCSERGVAPFPTALPKGLPISPKAIDFKYVSPTVSAGASHCTNVHTLHTNTHTHTRAHIHICMFGVFLTAKTTSGKHEGLNRITEAAERFPPLAGALLCSQQHLPAGQMGNQIPSTSAATNTKILFFPLVPSGIDKNVLNTWLLKKKKKAITRALFCHFGLFFHDFRNRRDIRKQCSHPCVLSNGVTGGTSVSSNSIHQMAADYQQLHRKPFHTLVAHMILLTENCC